MHPLPVSTVPMVDQVLKKTSVAKIRAGTTGDAAEAEGNYSEEPKKLKTPS